MEEVRRILEDAFARRRSLEDAAVERAFMTLLEGLEAGTLRALADTRRAEKNQVHQRPDFRRACFIRPSY